MSDDIVERLRVLLRCRCEPDAACCEVCSAVDAVEDELDRLRAAPERPCTCHPDDNPPVPCPKHYALTECREAVKERQP